MTEDLDKIPTMNFEGISNESILSGITLKHKMVIHMITEFPSTGDIIRDISTMCDSIYKWEDEATKRGISFKGIDEKIEELIND